MPRRHRVYSYELWDTDPEDPDYPTWYETYWFDKWIGIVSVDGEARFEAIALCGASRGCGGFGQGASWLLYKHYLGGDQCAVNATQAPPR